MRKAKALGAQLKQARLSAGLSLAQLATRARLRNRGSRIDAGGVWKAERGKARLPTIFMLARVLGFGIELPSIPELRTARRWTRQKLAAHARVHATTLRKIENDPQTVVLSKIECVYRALNAPLTLSA